MWDHIYYNEYYDYNGNYTDTDHYEYYTDAEIYEYYTDAEIYEEFNENYTDAFAAIRKCSKKFKKEIFESTELRNFAETQCNITERELYRGMNHTLKGFLLTSKTANQTP